MNHVLWILSNEISKSLKFLYKLWLMLEFSIALACIIYSKYNSKLLKDS